MLDPSSRARQRRCRRRRKQGRALLKVEVHEFDLVAALLKAGRLCETGGLQRPKIEQALAKLVEDWTARWLSRVA
jgi:hypothetical protein